MMLFAKCEEGVEHCCSLSGFVTSCKEIVFAADGNGPDDIFDQIVINFYVAMYHIQGHIVHSAQGVSDGFADGTGG